MEHPDHIPEDLATCQGLLRSAWQRLRDFERQLDEFAATTEERERAYACLKEEYLALKRLLFGPRRERLAEAPGQQHLFDSDTAPHDPDQSAESTPSEQPPARTRRKGHGRRGILDHLPRQDLLHDVAPEERVRACGREKAQIGQDVTEQVDYKPGPPGADLCGGTSIPSTPAPAARMA